MVDSLKAIATFSWDAIKVIYIRHNFLCTQLPPGAARELKWLKSTACITFGLQSISFAIFASKMNANILEYYEHFHGLIAIVMDALFLFIRWRWICFIHCSVYLKNFIEKAIEYVDKKALRRCSSSLIIFGICWCLVLILFKNRNKEDQRNWNDFHWK